MKILIFLIIILSWACSSQKKETSIRACGLDSRVSAKEKSYCVELKPHLVENARAVLLLLPGFSQSVKIFDLLPDQRVSFVRYLNEAHKISVYLLNPRGIDGSDLPVDSYLDDIAIDDIQIALDYIKQQSFGLPVILGGHSQGSIASQAYAAGIYRCGDVGCFSVTEAYLRAKILSGLMLFAGNSAMTFDPEPPHDSVVPILNWIALWSPLVQFFRPLDYISFRWVFNTLFPVEYKFWHPFSGKSSMAFWPVWNGLYLPQYVNDQIISTFFKETVHGTTRGIIDQFVDGIVNAGIRSTGAESYVESLSHIQIPVVQAAFAWDPFAPPQRLHDDAFALISSEKKKLYVYEAQSHEDFLLNSSLHQQHHVMVEDLLLWSSESR